MDIRDTLVPDDMFIKAMRSMRNPMNSWSKNDTVYDRELGKVVIGQNDKNLALKLGAAGPSHSKHLRFIMAYADIYAPLYWWKEFDTYRNGVEKLSTSTMHKLSSRPLADSDFEFEDEEEKFYFWLNVLPRLNHLIEKSKDDKVYWEKLVRELPSNFIQMRSVMMSYAAIKSICEQRTGHKLKEWHKFIDWAHNLPESWLIFGEEKQQNEP